MNPLIDDGAGGLGSELEQELLSDLEKQSLDQIRKLRKHQRFEVRVQVVLRSANSSNRDEPVIGTSIDVSDGGCMLQFPQPIAVGDVFKLVFEDERLDLPTIFAHCKRCRMVRDDLFEAGFSFFSSISLRVGEQDDSLLG